VGDPGGGVVGGLAVMMTLYDLHLSIADLRANPRVQVVARAVGQYLLLAGAHAALGVWVEASKGRMERVLRGEE
jgi:hypothetical protein